MLGFTASQYRPLEFHGYLYGDGFNALGWLIVLFCIMFIPMVALVTCYQKGVRLVTLDLTHYPATLNQTL